MQSPYQHTAVRGDQSVPFVCVIFFCEIDLFSFYFATVGYFVSLTIIAHASDPVALGCDFQHKASTSESVWEVVGACLTSAAVLYSEHCTIALCPKRCAVCGYYVRNKRDLVSVSQPRGLPGAILGPCPIIYTLQVRRSLPFIASSHSVVSRFDIRQSP